MSKKFVQISLLISILLTSSIALAQLQIVTPFAGSSCGGSTFANAINANGILTCATPSAGSVVLSGIGAATGANTIGSGNNTGQVWNWANTTNGTTAFTFGETSAATNGTSTTGVPNQVLLKLDTLSGSTQSPLKVLSRGSHVFSVSPTTAQILATNGSAASPTYSFAASASTGLFSATFNDIQFSANGTTVFFLDYGGVYVGNNMGFYATTGSGTSPSITNGAHADSGLFFGSSMLGISVGNTENSRFIAGALQHSMSTANTVSYAIDARKSRGTVASPTVITTGDDLLTISGYGYVGSTNTYREAARITLDSVGSISDATNGIGGNISLSTQKQGSDTSPQERARVDQLGHVVTIAGAANTPNMGACGTSPSISGTDNAMLIVVGTGGAASSCVANFGSTWAENAPVCVAQNDTDIVPHKISTTTTAVTIAAVAAFTAASKFHVHCIGMQ